MRDAEQAGDDNPFSFNSFVKSRSLPPVDIFADTPSSSSTTPPLPPPPRTRAPVDLFGPNSSVPISLPVPAPPPPVVVEKGPPQSTAAAKKKEDEDNPFAFHNWVKQQSAGAVSGGSNSSTPGTPGTPLSTEELMRKLKEAETRAAEAQRAMKAMKEKEAKEAAALEAVVQAVERNLAAATKRAELAEKKLAEVQAELDRRRLTGSNTDDRQRVEALEAQLAAAQSRNAALAAQVTALAENAAKEAHVLEAGGAALKQLAMQLLSADKIGPVAP